MSMAVVLQRVRDHLRSALALSADQCGVRVGGHPPASSGELYVAVDELGVECTARDHLREVYVVEVALWRRVGQWPDDRAGDALLRDDAYLAGALTLDRLERSVIARCTAITPTFPLPPMQPSAPAVQAEATCFNSPCTTLAAREPRPGRTAVSRAVPRHGSAAA